MNGFIRAGIGSAAALCLVVVPTGVALAGYQDGGYAGATEQSEAVTFRVADERIKRLDAVVYADCDDGTRQRITIRDGRTRIDAGRYSLELTGANDLQVSLSGRIRDAQAVGRIKASLRPPGTLCGVETRWQASLKSA